MNVLHSSLYAAALVSCMLMLLAVQAAPAERRRRARYFFALLTLLSLNFASEWLMSNPASPAKSLWLVMVMGLALLLGPCLWLYARDVTQPEASTRVRDLSPWHAVPIFLGLLLLVPLAGKIHLGTDFQHPDTVIPIARPTWVHITMLGSILVFAIQAGYYLRASLRRLTRQASAAKTLLSDLRDRELNSLRVLVLVVGAHWVFGMARALHCLLLGKDAGYVVLLAAGEVMFTLWAAIALMRAGFTPDAEDRKLANEIGDPKYARSALDAPVRERILRKLTEAWAVHRLHLDGQITLRSLCAHLRENPHYVSQVINQDLHTSFYDLVNQQRVRDAMDVLRREPRRTVLEIAEEVGFNSKSTFNAAFRQHAGVTPSEFRRGTAPAATSLTSDTPTFTRTLDDFGAPTTSKAPSPGRDATTPPNRAHAERGRARARTAGPTGG
jgi:AraC-like DNA-binding protein